MLTRSSVTQDLPKLLSKGNLSRNLSRATLLLLLAASLAFAANPWGNGPSKLSPDLALLLQQNPNAPVAVIVSYSNAPTQNQYKTAQQLGAHLNMQLPLVNAASYTMTPWTAQALAQQSNVAYLSIDHPMQAMDEFTDAAIGMSTVRGMGLGTSNNGIGVAVIDSGIYGNHDDLMNGKKSRVVYHQDFTTASELNSKGKLVYDTYGHGTHVAGIIAGDGKDSNGEWLGINYGVSLIDLRVLDGNGLGTDSEVIAALQEAIALKSKYNIRVINMSLGRPVFDSYLNDPVCQAVEQAWKDGIVVVAAAGNFGRISLNGSDGYGTITVPGNDPFVITVGAMKTMETLTVTDDRIASYSSKGPTTFDYVVKPDLVAPGNLISSLADPYSTLYNEFPANREKGSGSAYNYFLLSGTSMATPVVSGSAAILIQQNSKLTPDQIKARLMLTASKTFPTYSVATDPVTGQTYTSYYDLFTVGAGYLNLAAAVESTALAPANVGAALSPAATYNASNGTVSLVFGNSSITPSSVVWGNSTVWGTTVVWGATNVTSADSVVWAANSVVWADSNMSGFSVVWATSQTAATSVVWGGTGLAQVQQATSVPVFGEQ